MPNVFFNIPIPKNEPVLNYCPGSPEKKALKVELQRLKNQTIEIPIEIGGKEITIDQKLTSGLYWDSIIRQVKKRSSLPFKLH